ARLPGHPGNWPAGAYGQRLRTLLGPSQDLAIAVPPGITIEDVRRAREAIADLTRLTPAWPSPTLGAITGVPVFLKCEQMQRTGSFKVRGAANFVHRLSADQARRGLVAASAGNHAQGIAIAGSR